jgi:hypothetical protein
VSALAFFLVPAIAFVFGVRPQQIENHPLAGFPSLAQGWGFFTGLSQWATDNLPLRDTAVRAESQLSQSVLGEEPAYSSGGQPPATDGGLGPLGSSPAPPAPSASGGFPEVIAGNNGWLYYGVDIQAKCQATQPVPAIMSELAQLRSAIEASGRKFVLVIAPDKSTVLPQNLPADYVGKQCAQQFGDQFWTDVTSKQVGALDLRAQLSTTYRLDDLPTYFALDTHWTDAGALIMLRSVAERIQPGVSATWRTGPRPPFTTPADLPPLVGQSGMNTGHPYALRPDGSNDRTRPYGVILNQAVNLRGTPTTGMISTPVSVLGDSFLGAATRYLPAIFSDVTYVGYDWAANQPAALDQALVAGHVVVLEAAERNLTSGTAPFLQPSVISAIGSLLAAHPVH